MNTVTTTVMRAAAAFTLAAAVAGVSAGAAFAGTPSAAATSVGAAQSGNGTGSAEDELQATASRGVDVTNMSGDTMRLKSVNGDQWFEGRPADGAELRPGAVHRWEMQLQYMRDNNESVTYELIRPNGSKDGEVTFHMSLSVGLFGEVMQSTTCTKITSADGVTCDASTYNVILKDRAGTVRNLDGSGPNAVAVDVLQNLCNSGKATCDFTATSEEKRWGPAKQMGSRLGNVTAIAQSKDVTVTDSWASSDSLGGSVSLKIPIAPVELTLQATYNHTWTQTHTFAETLKVVAQPWHWGWVEQRAPYVRHTGTFVIKYSNTTWNITGVAIDSPDSSRQADTFARTTPMTQQEIDQIIVGLSESGGGWIVEPPTATSHVAGE
jgi:hypothetical protein